MFEKLRGIHPDFRRLLLATLFFGAANGIFQATFNNYLNEVHGLGAEARGWLEFPRELPGFLIMFVSAGLLTFLRETRMAALAMLLTAAGAAGLGLVAREVAPLVFFLVVWSVGDHVIFAVEGPVGLLLAKQGGEGRRLGQIGGARNLGVILGVGGIFLLARTLGDVYSIFYLIAAGCALVAGWFYLRLQVGRGAVPSRRMVIKRKYGVFYAISALFGVRKQIFMAFGGWVLVSIHGVPVSTIALLYFLAALAGGAAPAARRRDRLAGRAHGPVGRRGADPADLPLLRLRLGPAARALGPAPALRRLHPRQRAVRPAHRPDDLPEEDRGRSERDHPDDLDGRDHRPRGGDVAADPLGLCLGGLRVPLGLPDGGGDRGGRLLRLPADPGARRSRDARGRGRRFPMIRLLAIAGAGALGALARYGLSGLVQRWSGSNFPAGTLTVNLVGCFLLGLLATLAAERWTLSPTSRAAVLIGFLGAFTTFSTFSWETLALLRGGDVPRALLNVAASLGLGLVAAWGGYVLASRL